VDGNTHTHFLKEEHIFDTLERYTRDEENRMQTLAGSFEQGKKVAAITVAVNQYLQRKKE
ncbi:MAG: acetyl-CoA carboxylase biotin carboxylase subunit, partial [Methanomicrobiales archaeon]